MVAIDRTKVVGRTAGVDMLVVANREAEKSADNDVLGTKRDKGLQALSIYLSRMLLTWAMHHLLQGLQLWAAMLTRGTKLGTKTNKLNNMLTEPDPG